jgi:hypothetical protein
VTDYDVMREFPVRAGATLNYWQPHGVLEGVIETHPDHPPIMHWLDGHDEELKCDAEGRPIIVTVDPFVTSSIGVGKTD